MMKLSHIIIAVVLIAAAVYFVSQRSGAAGITQAGNDVSIAIGDHRLQAIIAGPEFTESFLVIGGMRSGNFHFNALLSVIPLDTAQALAGRYGDFRRCGSPGAAAGMESVESMILYATSGGVGRRLKKANKQALAGKDPVIEMTFCLLEMTNHKIVKSGHELQIPLQDIGPCFLVKEVRLIREGLRN
ncbi:MAG: hypothetical protein CEE38_13915 [Planctomycetes bacterium B3_Pla]|nr:MAG: hypothetical protein CEE38_13915 [Planctomycetes bacterium B3_Pla]